MAKKSNKLLLVGVITVVSLYIIGTAWNNLKPYSVSSWQVDTKGGDWKISQTIGTNINNLDDSTICNTAKYRAVLVQQAQQSGLSIDEITRVLDIADKQGPNGKIPVYIKTAKRDNRDVIIVVYKYGLGWIGRLNGMKPFIPRSMRSDEQWTVIVDQKDGKVIYSQGTM